MPDYRLYFHNSRGHFLRHLEIDAADDEAALGKAREIDHAFCIEVWCGNRLVGLVNPGDRTRN